MSQVRNKLVLIAKQAPFYGWQLLGASGIILCFFIVPATLLYLGVTQHIETQVRQKTAVVAEKLGRKLDRISRYQKEEIFYHDLLQLLWKRAEESPDAIRYLRQAIPHLQRAYPGWFRFVVWEKNGKLVPDLTDEKGLRYVLAKVWLVLHAIAENLQSSEPSIIDKIPEVIANRKIVQSFLGRILVMGHLNFPYQKNPPPQVILADVAARRAYLWYHIGKNVSVLCFLHKDAIGKFNCLTRLCDLSNAQGNTDISVGYASVEEPENAYLPPKTPYREELVAALRLFETTTESPIGTPHYMVLVRSINPHFRCLAFWLKDSFLEQPHREGIAIYVRAILLLVPVLLAMFVSLLLRKDFLSIRWKLASLFLFANGLPLLVLGFLGADYLQQRRAAILHELENDGRRMFTRLEGRYDFNYTLLEHTLMTHVKQTGEHLARGDFTRERQDALIKNLSLLEPSGIYIIASSGRRLDTWMPTHLDRHELHDLAYLSAMCGVMLRFLNGDRAAIAETVDGIVSSGDRSMGEEFVLRTGPNLRKIQRFLISVEPFWSFYAPLGKQDKGEYDYMLLILWSDVRMQELFLTRFLDLLAQNSTGLEIFAQVSHSERIFAPQPILQATAHLPQRVLSGQALSERALSEQMPAGQQIPAEQQEPTGQALPGQTPSEQIPSEQAPSEQDGAARHGAVRRLLQLVLQRGEARLAKLQYQGREYFGFGCTGRTLGDVAMVGLYPLAHVDALLEQYRRNFQLFVLLSLLLTFAIGQALARHFLVPIETLGQAALAMQRRNFEHRCQIRVIDEFGEMATVLNHVFTGLAELEVARVVQESLFPDSRLRQGRFHIFGRNIAMTELAGDYFDFFSVNTHQIAVIVGDVAGHGVPAALIMAMAKAGVFLNSQDPWNPEPVVTAVHEIIQSLRKGKGKRMMTFVVALIDTETGATTMVNAGHCYPLHITGGGHRANYVELNGSPLGVVKRLRLACTNFTVAPGDSLLLYTDGIIEALDNNRVPLGFPTFQEWASAAYAPHPESFYNNLLERYRQRSPQADDDLTLVIVQHTAEALEQGDGADDQ